MARLSIKLLTRGVMMTDKEKLDYLIEAMRHIAQAIDNETPDMALWEIRRAVKMIEEWDGDGA